ncbi:DUF3466 family protein [Alteromonas sp. KUL49]|uniref:DUF3466 family protein n=1 Tax=Alteromonas sp. KUL49 TaxID=2480798 RepID=UPI00102F05AB|nr:DUF3466 family protein [Alteromonas sp. KUL49]TAP40888.1 DUF3466 family protein [Alteromonas sp. KUL49]GEA11066.1 hypothetical protein KUL49_14410 [Alteromonas sp. KUL49]
MKRSQLAAAILMATGSFSAVAATYNVTPLPLQDTSRNTFALSIDNSGKTMAATQLEFNPPIDVEQLENDTTFFDIYSESLESEDDVKQGVFSNADYTLIVNYLLQNAESPVGQKLASYRTYITDTTDAELVPGLDEKNGKFEDDFSWSVSANGRDSVAGDYIVGDSTGIFIEEAYENEDGDTINYTYAESAQQAFVQVGNESKRLPAIDDTLGGFASARAINTNLQVAGFSTVSFNESLDNAIEVCADDEQRDDIPESFCRYIIYRGTFILPEMSDYFASNAQSGTFNYIFASEVNATIWQLDVNGDVISSQAYPLLFTPEEDNTLYNYTYALDINSQGIAVGEGMTGEFIGITRPSDTSSFELTEVQRVATVFRDGETVELLPRDENLISQASGINDSNWVSGTLLRATNDIARPRMFAYNLDTTEAFYPDGFFASSGVHANAINNNNIIVGRAENEATSDAIRETSAFMFNIDTQEFLDLNDLTACDSPYTLLEAIDINDNNEIIANARVKATNRYVSGEEVVNDQGETSEVDSIISVKLSPISNGSVDECDIDDDDAPYERQGASTSIAALLMGFALVLFRRRK